MFDAKFQYLFDRNAIEREQARKNRRVLFRLGGYGRKIMRRLFGSGKKSSQPGRPPNVHGKSPLKLLTLFDVDLQAQSVAVGPALFRPSAPMIASSTPGPQLLNEGGTAVQTRRGAGRAGKRKKLNYRARPFTDQALKTTSPKLAEFMRD